MSVYFKRLVEEVAHSAVAGFAAGALAAGDGLNKAAVLAGAVAAGRAVLGLLFGLFGAPDSPSGTH